MRLKRAEINNFRSIRQASVDFGEAASMFPKMKRWHSSPTSSQGLKPRRGRAKTTGHISTKF